MDNFHKIERLYGKENKVMKNMKVRTKLNLILVLVILLVALGSVVSVKNMEDVKDKALETMDASSRQSYDDSIKEQVGVVISLLTEINEEYKAGTYTLDEAKQIAAEEVRQMRYGEAGYFWIDQSDGTNVVLLGSDTEGTNRMDTKDAKGYQMVKEIIRVAVEDGGGYTDYVFPKEGETESSPKRSYSRAFEPFGWVVGTGNYIDYIDETVAKETQAMKENVKSALLAIIGMGSFLVVIVMAVCLYMAFSLSRSFQVAQIQKVTEEVTTSVAQLSSDAEQLLAFVGNDVVASYDMFDAVADAYNQDAGKIDALISDFSATSEELLASIDGVLDAMEGIATATNEGAKGTRENAQKTVEVKSEADTVTDEVGRCDQTAQRLTQDISVFVVD